MALFYIQVNMVINYILDAANKTRMGFAETTPDGAWFKTEVVPRAATFFTAYTAWLPKPERTPTKSLVLKNARKDLQPHFRELARRLRNSLPVTVTDVDLEEMGLPARPTGTSHPAPVAKRAPFIRVIPGEIRTVVIEYGNADTGRKGKPEGQHGPECCYVISDHPVTSLDELIHSTFDTNSPLVLEFREEDRGKIVYFALRWENTRGEKGPSSAIFSAVIP